MHPLRSKKPTRAQSWEPSRDWKEQKETAWAYFKCPRFTPPASYAVKTSHFFLKLPLQPPATNRSLSLKNFYPASFLFPNLQTFWSLMGRAPCCDKDNVKRGSWSPEEDATLRSYVERHGTGGNWIALPQKAGVCVCVWVFDEFLLFLLDFGDVSLIPMSHFVGPFDEV